MTKVATDLPDSQQRLLRDLKARDAPEWMLKKVLQLYYHDFESPAAMPKHLLVEDAKLAGVPEVAERAKAGKYDDPADSQAVPESDADE